MNDLLWGEYFHKIAPFVSATRQLRRKATVQKKRRSNQQ